MISHSADPADPLLRADRVGIDLDGCTILEDVSLEVWRGDWVALVGPNGSGKTTLVRALSRTLRLSRGRVTLGGQDLTEISSRSLARRIAVVPQVAPLALDYTTGDLVRMGRAPYQGRWGIEGRVDRDIADRAMVNAGVDALADRPASTLSGGEYQRTFIARALAQEPDLLLLDEPTAHLDLGAQIEVLDLLAGLKREGLALVTVLHDLNLASAYADRLYLLVNGRVVRSGAPEEVLTPERVRDGYGVDVVVIDHPVTGRPIVVPRRPNSADFVRLTPNS